jgi:hypothetical protein
MRCSSLARLLGLEVFWNCFLDRDAIFIVSGPTAC